MEETTNAWLSVPLTDYEAHMRSERVAQLDVLSALFGRALELRCPESVAVLGVAGGNGFDRVDPGITTRVVGIDINPAYLSETAARYDHLNGLELHCIDLARDVAAIEPVRLVHAALLFEHTGLGPCLDSAIALAAKGGSLSVVLQLPSDSEDGVADAGIASIQSLRSGFQLIDPQRFAALVGVHGFDMAFQQVVPVASGKSLWHAVFDRVAQTDF